MPPLVSQRCSSRTSSAAAPRSGPGPGSSVAAPARRRVDHRHRRHAAARDPGRGEPAVAHDDQFPAPAPVGAGADHLREPRERRQLLHASQRPDEAGEPVAPAGGRLEPLPGRQAGDLVREGVQGAVVRAVHQLAPGRHRGRVALHVLVPGARRGAPVQLVQARTAPPPPRAPGCAACTGAAGRRRAPCRRPPARLAASGTARARPRAVWTPRTAAGRARPWSSPTTSRAGCGSGGCSGAGARRSAAARARPPRRRARRRSRPPARPAPPCRGCACRRSPAVK